MTAEEQMATAPAEFLVAQPVAEKIPVNFLLFTGSLFCALLVVVLGWSI
jgi:hypothetical protein